MYTDHGCQDSGRPIVLCLCILITDVRIVVDTDVIVLCLCILITDVRIVVDP